MDTSFAISFGPELNSFCSAFMAFHKRSVVYLDLGEEYHSGQFRIELGSLGDCQLTDNCFYSISKYSQTSFFLILNYFLAYVNLPPSLIPQGNKKYVFITQPFQMSGT